MTDIKEMFKKWETKTISADEIDSAIMDWIYKNKNKEEEAKSASAAFLGMFLAEKKWFSSLFRFSKIMEMTTE